MIPAAALEALYATYTRRAYVHPDPLEVLYDYPDLRDREVAALVAASLSYGRVKSMSRRGAEGVPRPNSFERSTSAE